VRNHFREKTLGACGDIGSPANSQAKLASEGQLQMHPLSTGSNPVLITTSPLPSAGYGTKMEITDIG